MHPVRTAIVSAAFVVAVLALNPAARASVYSNTVTDPSGLGANLVSYWQFEDANIGNGTPVLDALGSHNGTAQGNVQIVSGVAGIGGNAVTFDGASEITAAATGSYPSGSSPFTFTGWIKTTQNPGASYPTIFETGTEQSQKNFSVILPSNTDGNFNTTVTGELGVSQHGSGVGGTTSITDGQWHFVAATYDGADYRLYVDGDTTPQATKSMATNIVPSTLRLGYGYAHLNGSLDEIAIFNKALSATEVNSLFNAVPEPASLATLGIFAAGLFLSRRRGV